MKTKKSESKRQITSIILHTGHLYANILALNKILGIPFSEAKRLARSKPSEEIHLCPYLNLNSNMSTDDIKNELDEYEIEIKIINQ
ncbi:hypothetical protein [uncultured phage cr60_1]|uniref:Uncharacterized protein n=1 Tax=uncultured phage cr60_1 TaxID=2772082 RepID=A0A7M1RRZ7_9CAUD|nr:hypothetical protein KNV49_gp83 [uncultured phage cr60_1]QOR56914.1 hypothetical protein [uncultured phage cr60_1]